MASSSGCVRGEVVLSSPDAGGRDVSASLPEDPIPVRRAAFSPLRSPDGSKSTLVKCRFPRSLRLTSRRQFLAVYENGLRTSSSSFTVFALPNGLDHSRLGLTLTRKVGGAVTRNRGKRLLREIFRVNHQGFRLPMDLVINGRRSMLDRPVPELERELLNCVARLTRRAAP